jgi:hypothetical protein
MVCREAAKPTVDDWCSKCILGNILFRYVNSMLLECVSQHGLFLRQLPTTYTVLQEVLGSHLTHLSSGKNAIFA